MGDIGQKSDVLHEIYHSIGGSVFSDLFYVTVVGEMVKASLLLL